MVEKYIMICLPRIILASLIVTSTGACSTLLNGTDQAVQIVTRGADQAVCEIIDARGSTHLIAKTPGTAIVERSAKPLRVECQKSGVGSANVLVESRAGLVGYLMGFAGAGVDFMTGAYKSYPDPIVIDMTRENRYRFRGVSGSADGNLPGRNPAPLPPGGRDQLAQLGPVPGAASGYSYLTRPGGPVISTHPRDFSQSAGPVQLPTQQIIQEPPFAQSTPLDQPYYPQDRTGRQGQWQDSNYPPQGGGRIPQRPETAALPPRPRSGGAGSYRVQVGAYRVSANSDRAYRKLRDEGYPNPYVSEGGNGLNRVRFGGYAGRAEAAEAARSYRQREGGDAVVVLDRR